MQHDKGVAAADGIGEVLDDGAANLTREVERLPGSRKTASGTSDGIKAANQVLADYYRCPPNLLQFLAVPQAVQRRGFFQFGKDTLCYGRLSHTDAAGNPEGELDDVLDQV